MRLHFTGSAFSPHHAGKATTSRHHLGSGPDHQPPNRRRPLAIGVPESSSPLVRIQPSPRPLPRRCDPHNSSSDLNLLFIHRKHKHTLTPTPTHTNPLFAHRARARAHTHTHTHDITKPQTTKPPGKRRALANKERRRFSVPPRPAPTCRPRARGRRRRRPVLAKDEFEVELVVGATVCSSHRRGPGCCGSSSGGGGDGGGGSGGGSSSAPLHARPLGPGGRGSAAKFPRRDRDTERSVPNLRAGHAPSRTRSRRHNPSLVPKPPRSP